jgi:hypothetical protein
MQFDVGWLEFLGRIAISGYHPKKKKGLVINDAALCCF